MFDMIYETARSIMYTVYLPSSVSAIMLAALSYVYAGTQAA